MDFEGEGAAAALGHRHGREQESHLYALRIWQCQAANVRSGNRQFPRITRTNVLSYRYCPLRGLVARYGGCAFRVPKTGGLRGDLGGIAVGEVGDVAFFDFAVLAEGFAEVDGLVGFAVGGWPASAGYVHVHRIKHYSPIINRQLRLIIKILHVYIFRAKIDLTA